MTKKRALIVGLLSGVAAGLAVAAVASFLDWRLNPAGVFHDASGTNWVVVVETAVSWFVPVTLLVSTVAAAALLWISSR